MADDRSQGGSPFERMTRFAHREGKRLAVGIVGGVVVIAGVVLMPLPGPGMLVVLAGLAILATQFQWAQDLLDRARDRAKDALARIRGRDDDADGDGADEDDTAGDRDDPPGDELDAGALGGRSDVA